MRKTDIRGEKLHTAHMINEVITQMPRAATDECLLGFLMPVQKHMIVANARYPGITTELQLSFSVFRALVMYKLHFPDAFAVPSC